jgi:hypothetical protein
MSIATKVMIQIASKLGEELWRVLVPNTVTENNVFFVFFFFFSISLFHYCYLFTAHRFQDLTEIRLHCIRTRR